MKYDFDEIVPRKDTDCVKYDNVKEIFGTDDIIVYTLTAHAQFLGDLCQRKVLIIPEV